MLATLLAAVICLRLSVATRWSAFSTASQVPDLRRVFSDCCAMLLEPRRGKTGNSNGGKLGRWRHEKAGMAPLAVRGANAISTAYSRAGRFAAKMACGCWGGPHMSDVSLPGEALFDAMRCRDGRDP